MGKVAIRVAESLRVKVVTHAFMRNCETISKLTYDGLTEKILTPAVPYWKTLSAGLGNLAEPATMASLEAMMGTC